MSSVVASLKPRPAHRGRARGPWSEELIDLVRAVSGGLLFGVPLLYTMEVWWVGSYSEAGRLGLVLALLIVPLLTLNMAAGFRSKRDSRVRDAVGDTVEGLAIGIVASAVVLVLLRQIEGPLWSRGVLGKVLYEAVPFCLGIGVARHFLHGDRSGTDDDDGDGANGRVVNATVADLGASAVGAVFVALSIAPTDEVPMIASSFGPGWLMLLVAASLVVSYAIVFVAGFVGQDQRLDNPGIVQRPLSETIVCYVVALFVSAVLLWLFQRGGPPWGDYFTRTIVLGLPAAVGGAAGRLAV